MHYELFALAAALLWAIASLLSVLPAAHLGAFAFSRYRMACVTAMLGLASLATGGFTAFSPSQLGWMALSGLIGIFVGDTALYACLNRLGPRRSGLLFACNALFTALLGLWLFDERLGGWRLLGGGLIFVGVLLAIAFGRRHDNRFEPIRGALWLGVSLGLLAALCQSLGSLIAKPVMSAGVDPVAASCTRMAASLLAHLLLRASGAPFARTRQPINLKVLGVVALNGFLAMALGMTLILLALKHGEVSLVAILSATTPVMLLPLLWLYTRHRPAASAWAGAALVVAGTALILGMKS